MYPRRMISFVWTLILVFISHMWTCDALECPCTVGPCPKMRSNISIADTCTKEFNQTFCVRTVNLTIRNGVVVKKREIYRCANFSSAKYDVELMIHIPMNDGEQVTIEYRCRDKNLCTTQHIQDDECDQALNTSLGFWPGDHMTTEEIRNLLPTLEPFDPNQQRSCKCIDKDHPGKVIHAKSRLCKWTNDVRKDSGRNFPTCPFDPRDFGVKKDKADLLRASIFCKMIDPKRRSDEKTKKRRFRCDFACKYSDHCNRPEEVEKIYCAAIRQLGSLTRLEPMQVVNSNPGSLYSHKAINADTITALVSVQPMTSYTWPKSAITQSTTEEPKPQTTTPTSLEVIKPNPDTMDMDKDQADQQDHDNDHTSQATTRDFKNETLNQTNIAIVKFGSCQMIFGLFIASWVMI